MNTIIHTPGSYFLELRQDYIALCATCGYKKSRDGKKSRSSPHCKAFILSILEGFAPYKKEGEPVTMTLCQWTQRMYGIYGRNAILDSLEELVGDGLITRRTYKTTTAEVYGYFLQYTVINERLATIPPSTFQMKPTSIGIVENETTPVSNETPLVENETTPPFQMGHFVDTTYVDTYVDTTKIQNSVVALATNAPPLAFSDEASRDEETPEPAHPIATHSPQAPLSEEKETAPAADTPASPDVPSSGKQAKKREKVPAQSKAEKQPKPAKAARPLVCRHCQMSFPSPDTGHTPRYVFCAAPECQERQRAFTDRCQQLQQRINQRRGAPLRKVGEKINEANCVQDLVWEYTDPQIYRAWKYLITDDFKWSKPDNKYKIGGSELLNLIAPSLQALAEKQGKRSSDDDLDVPGEQADEDEGENEIARRQRENFYRLHPELLAAAAGA